MRLLDASFISCHSRRRDKLAKEEKSGNHAQDELSMNEQEKLFSVYIWTSEN